MKNYKFFQSQAFKDKLLNYPCVDSNTAYFSGRKINVVGNTDYLDIERLSILGAEVHVNSTNKELSFTNVGILSVPFITTTSIECYYQILDYYIQNLQVFVHKMKGLEGYNHIVVILPPHSEESSIELDRMAYYAVYGLVKGLGELYAPHGLFINGIVLNDDPNEKYITEWVTYLSSDNSCNTVGQVICL